MDIALFLYDDLTPLDAIGPFDILGKMPRARVFTVGIEPGLVRSRGMSLALRANYGLTKVTAPDIIVVPGGPGADALAEDPVVQHWLRKVCATARAVLSVSTGSLILGGAGLLQGREATTHWRALENLAGYGAKVVRKRMVTSGNLITTNGAAAGMDAALALVEQIAGAETAQAIQLLVGYDPTPVPGSGLKDLFTASEKLQGLARTGLARP